MKNARPTIHDVARSAGVSYQTVSRVLNDSPHVAEETRQRVQAAIAELDYHPNRAARSLATNRSQHIGLLAFGTGFYGPSQMVANLERAADSRGYSIIFTGLNHATRLDLESGLRALVEGGVAGIVLVAPFKELSAALLREVAPLTPVVAVDSMGAGVNCTSIDQQLGGRLAAEHLISLGHRDIAFLLGPSGWFDARQRAAAWTDTLREHGLEPAARERGDWTPASGYQATQKLLQSGARFTAILAANDQMALGAMRALREAGREVPGDVSVTGFDDIPEAEFLTPPLTTIRQDFAALGRQTLGYLVGLIEHPDTVTVPSPLPPVLVSRASTATAPILAGGVLRWSTL
ncbi:MAG TPA: substrate-binding domain-containing protein [Deinococcales bacterium]|nr:substrate-binding domain-containing protein [Deinococcales bacterium]